MYLATIYDEVQMQQITIGKPAYHDYEQQFTEIMTSLRNMCRIGANDDQPEGCPLPVGIPNGEKFCLPRYQGPGYPQLTAKEHALFREKITERANRWIGGSPVVDSRTEGPPLEPDWTPVEDAGDESEDPLHTDSDVEIRDSTDTEITELTRNVVFTSSDDQAVQLWEEAQATQITQDTTESAADAEDVRRVASNTGPFRRSPSKKRSSEERDEDGRADAAREKYGQGQPRRSRQDDLDAPAKYLGRGYSVFNRPVPPTPGYSVTDRQDQTVRRHCKSANGRDPLRRHQEQQGTEGQSRIKLTVKSTVGLAVGRCRDRRVSYNQLKHDPRQALEVLTGVFSRDAYREEIDSLGYFSHSARSVPLARYILANITHAEACFCQGFNFVLPDIPTEMELAHEHLTGAPLPKFNSSKVDESMGPPDIRETCRREWMRLLALLQYFEDA